ncbi:MAG TPA: sigma-70 family RNA polymerase sigma factor [Polyangiaceae bacterium]|nr:sigma-70 family RNA polymerase sigma factor [Polyangiaceae bacterium]
MTQPAGPRPDEARLRRLFDEQFSWVWRFVRRLGVPEPQADDAAQQIFCVLAERLPELEPGREKSFLAGTALRVASNYRRSARRRREVPDAQRLEFAVDARDDPAQIAEHRSELALLDRALDQLPSELRAPFVLFEVENHSMLEIAELLGIPRGTVASRLRRAREQFLAAAQALQGGSSDRVG